MPQSVGAVALDIVMGRNTVSGVARQAISDVQRTFNEGTATIGNKVSAVGQACTAVGASLMPVSIAATGVIKSTTSAAMSFESAMAQVRTIAGDSAVSYKGSMKDMSDAIMQLSTDTGVAAEDVASATYQAISAGVDTSKSVEFVATANALAVGGFTDITTSVDVLTTTLNAYGDKAGTAESISDKLITTQNLGKTTVNELASSMGKVIPTASAYGVSIDNLCASYVAMTKGGIATAESTTYMKSMFNELADSGSNVGKILQENTGKSFGQLMQEGNSLADVIDILGKSVDGDSEAFAQLWGSSEAGTGALAILNGGVSDFNATLSEMGASTGSASSAMDKMNDTSAHKMQVAMNDMKNSAIQLGGAFAPVMSTIASAVSTVARAFSELPSPVKNGIGAILGITAVVGPVLMVVGTITKGIGGIISAASMIRTGMTSFIGFITGSVVPALSSFFAFIAANPIVLVIGAIIAIGALLITHWDQVKQIAGVVWEGIKNIVSVAWEGIKTAVTTAINIIKSVITTVWNGIKTVVTTVLNTIKTVVMTVWNGIKTTITTIINAIKTVITTVWNAIKTAITTVINTIKTVITTVFNAIKSVVTTVWNGIKTVITTVINTIKTVITTVFNAIKTVITTIFNGIKTVATTVWNGISGFISGVVNGIRGVVVGAFNGIRNGVSGAINGVKSIITGVFGGIKSFITGFASQAVTWGSDFMNGMAKGIQNAAKKVIDGVKSIGKKIKSFLHFSRPDEGPLRDYETWMPDFVQGMADGINNNKYKLIDAVKGMTNQMAVPAMAGVAEMQTPELKNIGNNATVHTGATGDDRLYGLLTQLITKLDNTGDITIPVYLGNDLIDEQIVKASDRRTVRSGGRA